MDQGVNSNSGSSGGGSNRPSVLDNVSETQILELERAFTDSNQQYFDELGESYGWSKEQSEEVRQHFAQRVGGGGGAGGGNLSASGGQGGSQGGGGAQTGGVAGSQNG